MKTIFKKIFAISCVVMICASVAISHVTGPIFPTTIQSGGFTKYDINGYPYVNASGITIDTSSLTNLTVNTATNVSSVLTDRTNTAYISSSGALLTTLQGTNNVVHVAAMPAISVTTDTNVFINGGTNYSWILNDTVTYADIGSNGLGSASSKPLWTTNSGMTITQTSTPLYTKGTNQVSFCYGATNIVNNITNAGVATYAAWASTNPVFTVNGGSGILQSITISGATNRDVVVWAFNRAPTATFTIGSAVSVGPVDMQYCIGNWATTNSQFGDWQVCGTNYQKTLCGLAMPIRNTESSQNIYLWATYLDTKSNYTANSTYVRTAVINDL